MSGSDSIRLRACMVVIQAGRILLVPHFNTDVGPIQWHIPGGGVEFGETLAQAAIREFAEETGLQATCGDMIGLYENIKPDKPWHSVTIAYWGTVTGGTIKAEKSPYGERRARRFSFEEVGQLPYYPPVIVDRAIAQSRYGN